MPLYIQQNNTFALTPAQEGILFHSLLQHDTPVYFEQRWCALNGDLDTAAFKSAWQRMVYTHDVLRAAFNWQQSGAPTQTVYAEAELPFEELDWSLYSRQDQQYRFQDFLQKDRAQGFDLSRPPLMRCTLIRLGQSRYRFVWSYHHLIMDGWSNGPLISELLNHYRSLQRRDDVPLNPTSGFQSFVQWLSVQDADAAREFWESELKGVEGNTEIPVPAPLFAKSISLKSLNSKSMSSNSMCSESDSRQPMDTFREVSLKLVESDHYRLVDAARKRRLTLNTLVQAAWSLWLSRCSGQSDVMFGTVLANRPPDLINANRILGMFINTVPARVQVQEDTLLTDWLAQMQQSQRTREQFGHVGLKDIQQVARQPSLFDSILVFENYPLSSVAALAKEQLDFSIEDIGGYEQSHYPLSLMVLPDPFEIVARYDARRFSEEGINNLLNTLMIILNNLASALLDTRATAVRVGDLSLLDEQTEQQQKTWGQGKQVSAPGNALYDRIYAQAYITPDHPALVSGQDTLSYRELVQETGKVANILANLDVKQGDRIGVCLQRDLHLPVTLLAILKLGAAYVPLDPDFPDDRLAYIAKHAELKAVVLESLAEETQTDALFGDVQHCILLDILLSEKGGNQETGYNPTEQHLTSVSESDLAYIIYTSGSTGKPKGVPITHGSLINFLGSMKEQPGITPDDRVLAVTTISFDISILELFLPLVNGATLVLGESHLGRDGQQLSRCIEENDITILQATPATWRILKEMDWQGSSKIKALCGGEALDVPLAEWLLGRTGELWNMYGPTETTIWSAALRVTSQHLQCGHVPVGGPIHNTGLLVLDDHLRPLPTGIPGQLYISGAGLSSGYWQQPELTANAFRHSETHSRLYRTGDRVCWHQDGTLMFLGRVDHQIKLRGFRIEPGEIEQVIAAQPQVHQALVMLREDRADHPALVAYAVLSGDPVTNETELDQIKAEVRRSLPEYMQPSAWVILKNMPQTPNGKVDRKSLPAPDESNTPNPEQQKRLPASPLQELTASIWAQALNLQRPLYLQDHFFECGGHSLLATRATGALQTTLKKEIPLRLLFEYPVLEDFVNQLQKSDNSSGYETTQFIEITPRDGVIPLSWAQERQWIQQQLNPQSTAYHIPAALRLKGEVNRRALEQALKALIQHHETLRQSFFEKEGIAFSRLVSPQQAIDRWSLLTTTIDEPTVPADSVQTSLANLNQPFDLGQPPLIRAHLMSAQQDHVLLLNIHHIAVDDWSLGILVRELENLYRGNAALQMKPDIGYADFAAWQRQQSHERDFTFWQQALSEIPEPLALPYRNHTSTPSQGVTRIPIHWDASFVDELQKVSQQHGVTLYMTLLAGFYMVLARYTGQTDLMIASPFANRQHPQSHHLVGMLVNTLLLRVNLANHPQLADLLQQVRTVTLDAFDHQNLPFERLISGLPQLRQREGNPVQAMFALQSAELDLFNLSGADWQVEEITPRHAKCDLNLSLRLVSDRKGQTGSRIEGYLEAPEGLFDSALLQRLPGHYKTLLSHFSQPPAQRYQQWPVLNLEDQNWYLNTCAGPTVNDTDTVPLRFHQQAETNPHSIAIVDGVTVLTYQQLEEKANQLAHVLVALNVGNETPVGLWAERSWHAILFMLAVTKAGGYFVPLDPRDPQARLESIIALSGVGIVMTSTGSQLPDVGEECVELPYDLIGDEVTAQPVTPPSVAISCEQLLYVMHTSGSTGIPKGVAVRHRGVLRLVVEPKYVQLDQNTVMLQAAPLAFDASTFEVWGALLNGGRLVVQSGCDFSLQHTADLISQHQVNCAWFTAGLLQAMIDEQPESLSCMSQLLAGGDVLSIPHLRRLKQVVPQLRIINGYGPTETTTFACTHTITQDDLDRSVVPIGKPIANTRIYLLDESLQQVPPGVNGELYIAGAGVARGYLEQPGLTAEQFIPNPFYRPGQMTDEQVLYRTGDLVRQAPSGDIEFLGRRDQQVKIRGFRIEINDIIQTINALSHLQTLHIDAVYTDIQNTRKQLVCWLHIPDVNEANQIIELLKTGLPERLPLYMIPAVWIAVADWPLTANGKLDRKQLPSPATEESYTKEVKGRAPTEMEQVLLDCWKPLFPTRDIQIQSDFFESGGDSIIAMQMVSRINRTGLTVTASSIFSYPTVELLAAHLEHNMKTENRYWQTAPTSPQGSMPLTPIQHWFFQRNLNNKNRFNQSVLLRFEGNVNQDLIERAVQAVVQRHDAFRVRFSNQDSGWLQQYSEHSAEVPIRWFQEDNTRKTAQRDQIIQQMQSGLDIEQGPVAAIAAIRSDSETRLLVVIHHLIVDGVSWRILMSDLFLAWRQLQAGHSVALGPKPYSWQQHCHQIQEYQIPQEHRQYWRTLATRFQDYRLPLDNPDAANCYADEARYTVTLDHKDTQALVDSSTRLPQARMLAALGKVLCEWTHQDSVLVNTETHGRNSTLDFSNTMGWFTHLYPVLLHATESNEPQSVQDEKDCHDEETLGLSYNALRYFGTDLNIDIAFNYLGQLDNGFPLDSGISREAAPGYNHHPENQRAHALEVNAHVENGQLQMEWSYSAKQFRAETIRTLAHNTLQCLQDSLHDVPSPSVDGIDEDDLMAALSQVSFGAD